MASIIKEYLDKRLDILDLQNELQNLIKRYNQLTNRYLMVYAADTNKGRFGVDVSLVQDDFYTIQDFLRETKSVTLDFYLETPGGSGVAAEEIAKFFRKKFCEVNFVIAGEAKSAGTILALSGDRIKMTETGSLGPIDAQVKIGRTMGSAHDYVEWIENKRAEASKNKALNPVDAVIISQISPIELSGVVNSLEFAKDLVKEWLEKYKFKNWVKTATRGIDVTDDMRKERAKEVAEMLCNHTTWRSHGRSLKIEDLKEVLEIESIDDEKDIADIVYRIRTIVRLIFDSSTIYKLYFLEDLRLSKTYSPGLSGNSLPQTASKTLLPKTQGNGNQAIQIPGVEFELQCTKCGKQHKVNGYINTNSQKIAELKLKTTKNIDDNDIMTCDNCSFALDLKPVKAHIEQQTGQKLFFK